MTLTLEHIDLRNEPPAVPRHVQIFAMEAVTMREREPAMKTLSERFKLGRTTLVEAPYGTVLASQRGSVQFFAASGGMLARSSMADTAFADERRPWRKLERSTDGGGAAFTLPQQMADRLIRDTLQMLTESRLTPGAASPLKAQPPTVQLEQWALPGENGLETAAGGGAATVHVGYEIDGIPLFGPGAKTQSRFEPKACTDGAELVEVLHAPRNLGEATQVELAFVDEALEHLVQDDRELQQLHEHGCHLRFDTVQFGFYALPVFEPQALLLPVLRVHGTATDPDRPRHESRFARIVSMLAPEDTINAELAARWAMALPIAAAREQRR